MEGSTELDLPTQTGGPFFRHVASSQSDRAGTAVPLAHFLFPSSPPPSGSLMLQLAQLVTLPQAEWTLYQEHSAPSMPPDFCYHFSHAATNRPGCSIDTEFKLYFLVPLPFNLLYKASGQRGVREGIAPAKSKTIFTLCQSLLQ